MQGLEPARARSADGHHGGSELSVALCDSLLSLHLCL
jgi:SapB morphogen precursor RamS